MDLSFIGSDLPPFGATPSTTMPQSAPTSGDATAQDPQSLVRELLSHLSTPGPTKPPTPKLWRQILGGIGDALAARGAVQAHQAPAPIGAYAAGQRRAQETYQSQVAAQREQENEIRRAAVVGLMNQGTARIKAGAPKSPHTLTDPETGKVYQLLPDPDNPGQWTYAEVPPQTVKPAPQTGAAPAPSAAVPAAPPPPAKKPGNLRIGPKQPAGQLVKNEQGYLEPVDKRTGMSMLTGKPVRAAAGANLQGIQQQLDNVAFLKDEMKKNYDAGPQSMAERAMGTAAANTFGGETGGKLGLSGLASRIDPHAVIHERDREAAATALAFPFTGSRRSVEGARQSILRVIPHYSDPPEVWAVFDKQVDRIVANARKMPWGSDPEAAAEQYGALIDSSFGTKPEGGTSGPSPEAKALVEKFRKRNKIGVK